MHGEVRVVADVAASFAELVIERAPSSVALSGGETARRAYVRLCAQRPDWSRTDIWFGDERWVDVSDADSNEGLARTALLDRVDTGLIHSMRGAGAGPEEAAIAYGRALRAAPPLDLVHLGLGPDGHTASLFPGSPALDEPHHWVVATGDGAHPHARVTLTLPAFAATRLVVFTVSGADRQPAFARVQQGDDVPAARVRAGEVLWLVDHDAAGGAV